MTALPAGCVGLLTGTCLTDCAAELLNTLLSLDPMLSLLHFMFRRYIKYRNQRVKHEIIITLNPFDT